MTDANKPAERQSLIARLREEGEYIASHTANGQRVDYDAEDGSLLLQAAEALELSSGGASGKCDHDIFSGNCTLTIEVDARAKYVGHKCSACGHGVHVPVEWEDSPGDPSEELERLRHYVATCGGTDNDGRCPMHHLAGLRSSGGASGSLLNVVVDSKERPKSVFVGGVEYFPGGASGSAKIVSPSLEKANG